MIEWLTNNWLELFGTLSGFLYIYLEIKSKVWLWPVGLLTSALYIVVFYNAKFYADMGLQWYYLFISIYGWIHWLKGGTEKGKNSLHIHNVPKEFIPQLTIITIALFILMGYILDNFTDSTIPWWDASTTSLSITATWMLARKYIEQWYIWIIVNFVSLGLYIYKDLHITVALFIAYFILSIIGLKQWQAKQKTQITA